MLIAVSCTRPHHDSERPFLGFRADPAVAALSWLTYGEVSAHSLAFMAALRAACVERNALALVCADLRS